MHISSKFQFYGFLSIKSTMQVQQRLQPTVLSAGDVRKVEKRRKEKYCGALLTDLSKAFDCLSHELLTAKLHAYGFNLPALKLIQSYLSNRKQWTKINATYSLWEEILFGVLQGSFLSPLIFNIFLCDQFWIMYQTDFASYADDNTYTLCFGRQHR